MGNRALVLSVFSFVDVIFIVEPPVSGVGGMVAHEGGGHVCVSFVKGSGVEVFVLSKLAGLFDVVDHTLDGVSVSFICLGKPFIMRGVYVRPQTTREEFVGFILNWDRCDLLFGDFNARHSMWDPNAYYAHANGRWLKRFIDDRSMVVYHADRPTFRNTSIIDLCIARRSHPYSYDSKAGLEHSAILVRLHADVPENAERRRPNWRMVDQEMLVVGLRALKDKTDGVRW